MAMQLVVCALAIAAASANACDLAAPRFDPTQATSDSNATRIPRAIEVELAGFATIADAARCFGARYHAERSAEHVTAIVKVGDGWGYLVPGKGGAKAHHVQTRRLMDAYRAAGFRIHALAHTHPYGRLHFSQDDVASLMTSRGGEMYMTNRRNETFRMSPGMLAKRLEAEGFHVDPRGARRLAMGEGFRGEPVF